MFVGELGNDGVIGVVLAAGRLLIGEEALLRKTAEVSVLGEGSTRQGPLAMRSLVSMEGLFREVLPSSSSADALTVLFRCGVEELSSGWSMLPRADDSALELSDKPLSGSSEMDGASWSGDSC